MSHGHTHGPGEDHSHSHSHAPQQAQPQVLPPPDPALQAIIDQDYRPTPLTLTDDKNRALCSAHKLEKCTPCDVDFVNLNRLSALLVANPNLLCPPPANVITQKITQIVTATKDEGNALFKAQQYNQSIQRYSNAAMLAVSRPPWEANQFMREELSTVISNRSAAYYESHDFIGALADAETVIQVRRNWSKGHFRKAKALLGMRKFKDAADAVKVGLSFEPTNAELISFLAEIENFEAKLEHKQDDAPQPISAKA